MGRYEMAVECAERTVKIQPNFFDANLMFSKALFQNAEYSKAIENFNKTLKIKPDDKESITFLARTHYFSGDEKTAYQLIKPLLAEKYIGCIPTYFLISKKLGLYDDAAKHTESIINDENVRNKSATLHFLLGKYYDHKALHDKAFLHYQKGNKLSNRNSEIKDSEKEFNRIAALFSKASNKRSDSSSINSKQPVFIVGMPRTGTTLVEQILASHPEVYGAGELINIDIAAKEAEFKFHKKHGYPESISSLNTNELDSMASEYLESVNLKTNGAQRITDKMPHNFMYIGLIFRLFPNAYIINTQRHPLDTCLSCYFSEFGTQGHTYSYNLSDMGKYYLLYDKLMSHWKNVYGDRICQIKYKDLILNHETTCKKMVAFCDLEWDDRCLNFHQSNRKINTLSHDQVNKPIYTGSLDRWKNYSKHTSALKKRLKTVIANY